MARNTALLLVGFLALSSCHSGPGPLVVASKNFTEQIVLGEIVAQHLENRLGQRIDRKLNLGGTMLVHQAMLRGQVDIYPEYTGTALTSVLKRPASADSAQVLADVRAAYSAQYHITWFPPLGFNDTFAMVVRGSEAKHLGVTTLSDAATKREWHLGVGYEFASRPDGLPALLHAYPLKFTGSPITMDLGLLYQALQSGQVSMVAGNSTDGALARLDATVLTDDRHAFPPYQACLLVRQASLAREPRLKAALDELTGRLDEQNMRKLNYQVDREHHPVRIVAEQFLRGIK